MISDISEEKTHIPKLAQNVVHSPKSNVVLGLLEDHPSSDALNAVLDINISVLWEESEIFPK